MFPQPRSNRSEWAQRPPSMSKMGPVTVPNVLNEARPRGPTALKIENRGYPNFGPIHQLVRMFIYTYICCLRYIVYTAVFQWNQIIRKFLPVPLNSNTNNLKFIQPRVRDRECLNSGYLKRWTFWIDNLAVRTGVPESIRKWTSRDLDILVTHFSTDSRDVYCMYRERGRLR
jgi:hypothetical protein